MHPSHSNSFSDLAAALTLAPPSNLLAKAEESSRFLSAGCCSDVFVWHQQNKNTSSKSQKDVSLPQKNLVSRNELRDNIGARDVDVLIANFLLQVREFFEETAFSMCKVSFIDNDEATNLQ